MEGKGFTRKIVLQFIQMFLKENAFFFKVTKAVKPEEEEPKAEKPPKVEPKPVEKIKKPEGTNKKEDSYIH